MALFPQSRPRRKVRLRVLLLVPYLTLLVSAVALTGFLSFRNGANAVNEVVGQLRNRLVAGIDAHVRDVIRAPHQINLANAIAMRQGALNPRDAATLEHIFSQQVQVFDSVTSIYFGNPAGGLVNAGREGPYGGSYVIVTDGFTTGPFKKYATDDQGSRTALVATIPDYDARSRPWYTSAVKRGKASWSEVYVLFTGQDMAIAASLPVYDDRQNLLGVVAVDLFLSHINSFLQSIEIGKSGQGFIMERSGRLVAASSAEPVYIKPNEDNPPKRLHAGESGNRLIQATAEFLTERFGDYRLIHGVQYLDFSIEGRRHFLQVSPIDDEYGLDWLIAVVIPEADFMAQITTNNQSTALMIGCALAAAVFIAAFTARWITRPITRLDASTQALSRSQRAQAVRDDSGVIEISELTQSFNMMADRLQHSLESLASEISERKLIENDLRANKERLDLVIKGASLGFWDWDLSTGRIVRNHRWAEIFGYELSEVEPDLASWENLIHPDDAEYAQAVLNDHLAGRTEFFQTEMRMRARSGEWKWVLDVGKVIARDEQGKPSRAAGIVQDITDRKTAESFTLTALKEKEILLREIHHRVKNNLQVVISLINLQAGQLKNPMMAEALHVCQQRIRAMAVIHETLHASPNLAAIQLSGYLSNLVKQLYAVFNEQTDAHITVLADEILLNMDQAIACGLIINELVTNALKYAFPNVTGGKVHVRARLAEDAHVELDVCDNGVGLPSDFDLPMVSSLGLQLVRGLAEHQLAGTCRVHVNGGTTFKIRWPLHPEKA